VFFLSFSYCLPVSGEIKLYILWGWIIRIRVIAVVRVEGWVLGYGYDLGLGLLW